MPCMPQCGEISAYKSSLTLNNNLSILTYSWRTSAHPPTYIHTSTMISGFYTFTTNTMSFSLLYFSLQLVKDIRGRDLNSGTIPPRTWLHIHAHTSYRSRKQQCSFMHSGSFLYLVYKRSWMYGTTLAAPHSNENIVYIFLFIPYTATYSLVLYSLYVYSSEHCRIKRNFLYSVILYGRNALLVLSSI
jgi:hypothetical protein